jgi:hypothetical protein
MFGAPVREETQMFFELPGQDGHGHPGEILPRVPTMIDREQIKVIRLVATPHSVIQ